MEQRLPAHLEVSGLIRSVQNAGGFAMVIEKGERDAGTILLICCQKATKWRIFERMPQIDGTRKWVRTELEDIENKTVLSDYITRRKKQDPDLWIVELDVDDPAQAVTGLPSID